MSVDVLRCAAALERIAAALERLNWEQVFAGAESRKPTPQRYHLYRCDECGYTTSDEFLWREGVSCVDGRKASCPGLMHQVPSVSIVTCSCGRPGVARDSRGPRLIDCLRCGRAAEACQCGPRVRP